MRGTDVIHNRVWREHSSISESTDSKENIRVFAESPNTEIIVTEPPEMSENLLTKCHVCANAVVNVDDRWWVCRKIPCQLAIH
jgi:hypothetical protein